MFLENFTFKTFYMFVVLSALFVVLSSNAVYSVLFLILTFCNVVFTTLFMGAEFIAFLTLIVYVGAIAVTFTFVMMMTNMETNKNVLNDDNILCSIPLTFMGMLFYMDNTYNFSSLFDVLGGTVYLKHTLNWANWACEMQTTTNIENIGKIFYTNYCLTFIIASLVLLVSMMGVIVLTVHQKSSNFKKQKIEQQVNKNFKKTIKFIHMRR
uniref:NADH dehydrogenase subunit 6 n=1 Tax=Bostrychia tenuissima TaxID=196631 RepID=UPI002E78AD46|nr:NADH dehydrogenase subunit 6 [Bostrychia tenuissima]WQF69437.1 NADH dehydrogenase subunit 6 [Bostrychia tenuissima]